MLSARRKIFLGWAAIVTLMLTSVGISATMVQESRKLGRSLEQAKALNRELVASNQTMQDQLATLKTEQSKAADEKQSLQLDRDNVLAQFRRIEGDREQAASQQALLTGVIKRAGEEIRGLKGTLEPLRAEHSALQDEYAALLSERNALRGELIELKDQSQEASLRSQLTEEQLSRKRAADGLQQAQTRIKGLESDQGELRQQVADSKGRFDKLQEQYTKIMSENTALRRQTSKVPANVARMAKQHEKLLKETADMHYNLGVLFTRNKQYYQAAQEFRKVLEMRPDDADTLYNLGVIYAEHLPDREKAVTYFRKYIEINPRAGDSNWVKEYIASWQAWEAKDRLD